MNKQTLQSTRFGGFYYYAESDTGTWKGDNIRTFKGDKIGFKKKDLSNGDYGKRVVSLTCKWFIIVVFIQIDL